MFTQMRLIVPGSVEMYISLHAKRNEKLLFELAMMYVLNTSLRASTEVCIIIESNLILNTILILFGMQSA